jgi:hypothetical protein
VSAPQDGPRLRIDDPLPVEFKRIADQVGRTNALSINDFPQQPATTMCIEVHFAGRMFRKQCLASTTLGA